MPARLALLPAALPLLAAGLVLGLAGCKKTYDNPFSPSTTHRPDAAAALVFTSDSYSATRGAPRDLFAVEESGAHPDRLTVCGGSCDSLEVAPGPDRRRVALRRVMRDTTGDGQVTAADGAAIVIVDLERSVEGVITPPESRVTGLDWSRGGEFLVYSADVTGGGGDDLFRTDANGLNTVNVTSSAEIRERRPRLHPAGNALAYERIERGRTGAIWIFQSVVVQGPVTPSSPATEALPGTPYFVGSDADPSFSPDGRAIVYRRLRALGNNGLGSWDVMTIRLDGTGSTVVASGPAFRGAPDWGTNGIVFNEVDVTAGRSSLVIVAPDGSNRRVPLATASAVRLEAPRWLP